MRKRVQHAAWILAAAATVALLLMVGTPASRRPLDRASADEVGRAVMPPAPRRPRGLHRQPVLLEDYPEGNPVPLGELMDDPNRIPGKDLTIRGVVVRSGEPVGGATVGLHRARGSSDGRPDWVNTALPWGSWKEPRSGAIDEGVTDDEGRFELRTTRRSRLVLSVSHESSAPRRLLLYAPSRGDCDPVRVELFGGNRLAIRIVTRSGQGVPDQTVSIAIPSVSYPVVSRDESWVSVAARIGPTPRTARTARTDVQGLVQFDNVPAGSTEVVAASQRAFLVVPTGNEVVFVHEPSGAVEGLLSDHRGNPVAGAVLRVETARAENRTGIASAKTDAEGRFRMRDVPPGGLVSARVEGRGPLSIPAERVPSAGVLRWDPVLPARAVATGTVTADDGDLVTGARLLVRWGSETVAAGWSDEGGAFRIEHLEPGRYTLHAEACGMAARVPLRVPGNAIQVELEPCARVLGRIRDLEAPDRRFRRVTLKAEDFEMRTFVDGQGRFAFEHVPPLERARLTGAAFSGTFAVPPGAIVVVDLDGRGGIVARGVVTDVEGRPLAGVVVRATTAPYGFLAYRMIDPAIRGNTITDDHGRFEVRVVGRTQKSFAVLANHPGYAAVQSEWIKIPAAGQTAQVPLVLKRGLPIAGRVLNADGSSARDALVTLDPVGHAETTDGRLRLPADTHTDHKGAFSFRHQAPGAYSLLVISDAAVIQRDVKAGQPNLVFRYEHDAFIAGVVLDASGQPARDRFGMFVYADERLGMVGPSGHFRIGHLPRGSYDVSVEQILQGDAGVRQVPTGTDDLALRLPPDRLISVELDEQGEPTLRVADD